MQLRLPGMPEVNPQPANPEMREEAGNAAEPEPTVSEEARATARLSAELEAALVRELREAYRQTNASLFRNALRPPTLELSGASTWLGRWCSATRTLEIGRALAVEQPWTLVLEVLKHEMAHQYVDEVLGEPDMGHGPAFRDVCERLGIDPKASGLPSDQAACEDETQERVLTRVARLLALADSPNENEAKAAMSAAQRLMLRYNIDQAEAATSPQHYGFRQVGRITGRVSESERLLAGLLGEHFFVEVIWVPAYEPTVGKSGSVLEICGSDANLEMASYVHAFLSHTAQRLWDSYQQDTGLRSNRDRQTFLAGVILGFHERLNDERVQHEGRGLVWVGDAELEGYLRRRHPHIRRVRLRGNRRTEARERGKEAGRSIVLRKPVQGRSKSGGKILPPGRSS